MKVNILVLILLAVSIHVSAQKFATKIGHIKFNDYPLSYT